MSRGAAALAALLALLPAGCATITFSERAPSGMERVRVSKSPGRPAVETRTPILTREDPSSFGGASLAPAVETPAAPEPDEPEGERLSSEGSGARLRFNGLEAGWQPTWIFTKLKTSFHSSAAPGLDWADGAADPSGTGFQAALYLGDEPDEPSLGLRGGWFQGSRRTQARSAGGFHVTETAETRGGWLSGEARVFPRPWCFASLGLGVFVYSLTTRLVTDLPSYEYDGLSGVRALGGLGLGGGLSTPPLGPVRAKVEARWWFAHDQDPPLELGVGQVGAGLELAF